jgi:hypothetical protein
VLPKPSLSRVVADGLRSEYQEKHTRHAEKDRNAEGKQPSPHE